MLKESYNYLSSPNKAIYLFESEGKNGKIMKVIAFTSVGKSLWNLGFGDLHNEQIDDSVISNNHDIVKLISTIAKITYEFSDEFPSRRIQIKPVDDKRKRLYNHVFRRNYEVIKATFQITGINGRKKEPYSPEKFYDNFELKRKFVK